jgi:3'(2'), 5'-bisphosphate nucleotidase
MTLLESLKINTIKNIALEAGNIIMDVYRAEDFKDEIDYKADDSPLTIADQRSHHYIAEQLKNIYPEIPLISEEGNDTPYDKRKNWQSFWLVDPLDGTKEFIKKNGQFTVNIAFIENGQPLLGVIYAPDRNELFYAKKGEGAFKQNKNGEIQKLSVNRKSKGIIGIRSRSHGAPEEETIFEKYGVNEFTNMGSSLKFCMVAEGKADVYYRHHPTMEWDTAAGQAIVEEAGGKVYQGMEEKETFTYNKESLRNGSFLCLGW